MTNEEKILEMLSAIQSDVRTLKYDVKVLKEKKQADDFEKMTPEERKTRQLAALDAFINSTTDEEEPEATAAFFKHMDEETVRKAAAW